MPGCETFTIDLLVKQNLSKMAEGVMILWVIPETRGWNAGSSGPFILGQSSWIVSLFESMSPVFRGE